jgi:uncharacterized UBP type Zn finger protein
VYPSKFKRSLGKQRSQFAGNDQQDGQEFLTVILDALHEVLNCNTILPSLQCNTMLTVIHSAEDTVCCYASALLRASALLQCACMHAYVYCSMSVQLHEDHTTRVNTMCTAALCAQ